MSLLGTAREALENHRYTKLVEKYDEYVAERLIEHQLKECGLSLKEFRTYRKVKAVIQNNGLDVKSAQKEAEREVKLILANDQPC